MTLHRYHVERLYFTLRIGFKAPVAVSLMHNMVLCMCTNLYTIVYVDTWVRYTILCLLKEERCSQASRGTLKFIEEIWYARFIYGHKSLDHLLDVCWPIFVGWMDINFVRFLQTVCFLFPYQLWRIEDIFALVRGRQIYQ